MSRYAVEQLDYAKLTERFHNRFQPSYYEYIPDLLQFVIDLEYGKTLSKEQQQQSKAFWELVASRAEEICLRLEEYMRTEFYEWTNIDELGPLFRYNQIAVKKNLPQIYSREAKQAMIIRKLED